MRILFEFALERRSGESRLSLMLNIGIFNPNDTQLVEILIRSTLQLVSGTSMHYYHV